MILLFQFLVVCFHPIHISVTEIEYNEKAKALEIVTRIFIDDLETAVRAQTNQPQLDILNPKGGQTTKQLVASYLRENLKIKLDNKQGEIILLGYEEENFALVCYVEVADVISFKAVEVTNTVITEIYDDQSNLVHITYKGPVKSTRLMKDKPSDTFTFN